MTGKAITSSFLSSPFLDRLPPPPSRADREFKAFYGKHCTASGCVTYEQALALAKQGLRYFQEGLGAKPQNKEEAEHKLSCLAWAIKYHAAAQGKPYTNGMAVLRPEVVERLGIKDHFGDFLHSRPSSHYDKQRAPEQYGLDIERGKEHSLPVDKATVLMGKVDTPIGTPGELYQQGRFRRAVDNSYFLKFETQPCHLSLSWTALKHLPQTIMHGLEYLVKKCFSSFFLSANGLASRKEKTIPAKHKKTFEHLLQAVHGKGTKEYRQATEKVEKYGLAYMDYYRKDIRSKVARGEIRDKAAAAKLLKEGRVQNLMHYLNERDNLDIRKGEEFIVDSSIIEDYRFG